MENAISRLYKQSAQPTAFARGYLDHLKSILDRLDADAIGRFVETLLRAREEERTVFFIGNGGSAATASHFANDIAVGTRSQGKPFRAVSLTDNVAVMTAIANDYGYEDLFVRQLSYQVRPGDVVVAISASGNSPNVLKAVDFARELGATTIGLSGFDGGELRRRVDLAVHVQTERGEYGPVEDVHMILDHLVGGYLIQLCLAETAA